MRMLSAKKVRNQWKMANQALLCEEVVDTSSRGGFAAIETHVLDIPTFNETHEQSHGTRCNTAKFRFTAWNVYFGDSVNYR